MVLFLFFTLQSYRIVCIFLSNSFPFSYYLHFSFHYLLLHNKCSTCHQFYYIYNMKRGILILDGNRNYIKLICVCVCFFSHFFHKLLDNYTFILMTIGWFKFPDVKTNHITLIFSTPNYPFK